MPSTDLAVDRPESQTAKARSVWLTRTAHRAADNPAELARATRIVRAALARQRLTLAELTPLPATREAGAA